MSRLHETITENIGLGTIIIQIITILKEIEDQSKINLEK